MRRPPLGVRFRQLSCPPFCRLPNAVGLRAIRNVISGFIRGDVDPQRDAWLILQVVKKGDRLISMDNRRLRCLHEWQRQAPSQLVLARIRVEVWNPMFDLLLRRDFLVLGVTPPSRLRRPPCTVFGVGKRAICGDNVFQRGARPRGWLLPPFRLRRRRRDGDPQRNGLHTKMAPRDAVDCARLHDPPQPRSTCLIPKFNLQHDTFTAGL